MKILCDVLFHDKAGNKTYRCRVQSVLHVLESEYPLFSVNTKDVKGFGRTFDYLQYIVKKRERTVVTEILQGSPYSSGKQRPGRSAGVANLRSSQIWHERLAHVNEMEVMQMLKKWAVRGVRQFLMMEDQNALPVYLVKHTAHLYQNVDHLSVPLDCSTLHKQICVVQMRLHLRGDLGTLSPLLTGMQLGYCLPCET